MDPTKAERTPRASAICLNGAATSCNSIGGDRDIMVRFDRQRSPGTANPASQSAGKAMITDKSGAGEGIRTLDPNLGKVVLYP